MVNRNRIRSCFFGNRLFVEGKPNGNRGLRLYFLCVVILAYKANVQCVGVFINSVLLHCFDLLFGKLLTFFFGLLGLQKALCFKNNFLCLPFFIDKSLVIIEHFYSRKAFDFNVLALSAKLVQAILCESCRYKLSLELFVVFKNFSQESRNASLFFRLFSFPGLLLRFRNFLFRFSRLCTVFFHFCELRSVFPGFLALLSGFFFGFRFGSFYFILFFLFFVFPGFLFFRFLYFRLYLFRLSFSGNDAYFGSGLTFLPGKCFLFFNGSCLFGNLLLFFGSLRLYNLFLGILFLLLYRFFFLFFRRFYFRLSLFLFLLQLLDQSFKKLCLRRYRKLRILITIYRKLEADLVIRLVLIKEGN